MKKQDIKAEIDFFNEAVRKGRIETASDELYKQVFPKIKSYFGEYIMEAGCGSGIFGLEIKKEKPRSLLIGVDITSAMINIAGKKKVYDKLYCENIENGSIFGKEKFDTIICPYLLHHLPDIRQVLSNFYQWLKPGGYLIIIDPNGSNLILKLSYVLRIIILKFLNIKNNFASLNEKNKTIAEWRFYLKRYQIAFINTFFYNPQKNRLNKQVPLSLYILSLARQEILRFYSHLPFSPFNGSDLIIAAKKNKSI